MRRGSGGHERHQAGRHARGVRRGDARADALSRHAAFLGSVNVGGNRVDMAGLRAALTGDGFGGVETVVASGNVLFEGEGDDAALAARIARVVEQGFGFAPFVAVRTCDEVAAAIADNPFGADGEDKQVHTQFLESQPEPAAFERLVADHAGRGRERLALGPRALYIDYVDGAGQTRLTGDFIARRLGCRGTARNLRSLQRILDKMS